MYKLDYKTVCWNQTTNYSGQLFHLFLQRLASTVFRKLISLEMQKLSAQNKITKIQIQMSGFALFENEFSMANSQPAQTSKTIEQKSWKQI